MRVFQTSTIWSGGGVMVLLLRVRLHVLLLEIITIYHLAVAWPCLNRPLADTDLSVSLQPSVLVSGFRCCFLHWLSCFQAGPGMPDFWLGVSLYVGVSSALW